MGVTKCSTLPGIMVALAGGATTAGNGAAHVSDRNNGAIKFSDWSTIDNTFFGTDGPDCSHRVSPHGDDPLTTVKSSMMKQVVQVGHTDNSAFSTDARTREEFLMVYHDPYGGVWRTDGIVASTSDIIAASRVQDALRALPNEVLEGVP